MGEFFSSIRQFFSERVASPLLRTLTVTWFVLNYEVIFTLFGGGPYEHKFDYIANDIYANEWEFALRIIVGPIALTAFFIWAFPKLDLLVYETWLDNQENLKVARTKREDNEPLTRKKAFQLRGRIAELEQELQDIHEKLAAQYDAQLTQLRNENAAKVAELEEKLAALRDAGSVGSGWISPQRRDSAGTAGPRGPEGATRPDDSIESLFRNDQLVHLAIDVLRNLNANKSEGLPYELLFSAAAKNDYSDTRRAHVVDKLHMSGLVLVDGADPYDDRTRYTITSSGQRLLKLSGMSRNTGPRYI